MHAYARAKTEERNHPKKTWSGDVDDVWGWRTEDGEEWEKKRDSDTESVRVLRDGLDSIETESAYSRAAYRR
jgi:hypothetical protein